MSVHPSIVQQGGPPSPGWDRTANSPPQPGTETAFAAAMEAWLALLQPLSGPPIVGSGVGSGQSPGWEAGMQTPSARLSLQGWATEGPVDPWPTSRGTPGEAGGADPRLLGLDPAAVLRPSTGGPQPVDASIPEVEGLSWQATVLHPGPASRTQPSPDGVETALRPPPMAPVGPPTEPTGEPRELLRPGPGIEPAAISPGNAVVVAEGGTTTAEPPGAGPRISSPASQIADQVQTLLERGERQATLRLNPPELGRVHIRLEIQDGRLHLAIRTEHLETGRLIDQRLTDLRHGLESRGLHLGDVRVQAESLNGLGEAPRGLLRSVPMDLGGEMARQGQPHPEAFGAMADNGSPGRSPAGPAYEAAPEDREEVAGAQRTPGTPAALSGLRGIDTYA